MRSCSRPRSSNRHSSTLVAWREYRAKLTPSPSQVAPSGYGVPSSSRDWRLHLRVGTVVLLSRGSFVGRLLQRACGDLGLHQALGHAPVAQLLAVGAALGLPDLARELARAALAFGRVHGVIPHAVVHTATGERANSVDSGTLPGESSPSRAPPSTSRQCPAGRRRLRASQCASGSSRPSPCTAAASPTSAPAHSRWWPLPRRKATTSVPAGCGV